MRTKRLEIDPRAQVGVERKLARVGHCRSRKDWRPRKPRDRLTDRLTRNLTGYAMVVLFSKICPRSRWVESPWNKPRQHWVISTRIADEEWDYQPTETSSLQFIQFDCSVVSFTKRIAEYTAVNQGIINEHVTTSRNVSLLYCKHTSSQLCRIVPTFNLHFYLPSLIFLCFRRAFHELHLVRRREKCCGTHPNKGSQKTLPLCFRFRFFAFAFDKNLQLQCEKWDRR